MVSTKLEAYYKFKNGCYIYNYIILVSLLSAFKYNEKHLPKAEVCLQTLLITLLESMVITGWK